MNAPEAIDIEASQLLEEMGLGDDEEDSMRKSRVFPKNLLDKEREKSLK